MDGFHAVSVFFVISGFYMTLILNEKYTAYGPFIANRLLKLYPAYLFSIVLAHLLSPISFRDLPFWPQVYFVFANLFMLFSEITAIIIKLPGDVFSIMPLGGSWQSETSTWGLLYNGPVWSLSVELMFYLIAPFVVKIDAGYIRRVATLIAASVASNFTLYSLGSLHVPWDYNFFPPNLYLFMLGSLSFYLFKTGKLQALLPFWRTAGVGMLAFMLAFTVAYPLLPRFPLFVGGATISPLTAYIALLLVFMPYIFEALRDVRASTLARADSMIGDLSYPVYIVHFVVLTRIPLLKGIDPVIATLGVATLTHVAIMRPIERHVRSRIKIGRGDPRHPTSATDRKATSLAGKERS
jgi:peptidoglycan/LPS O-acetylase OafA/YrhL